MQSKKKHYLVYNDTIYLPLTNRLGMHKIKEDENFIYFEFTPYKKLIDTKSTFEEIQNSMDINLLMDFLHDNPSHPYALFAVSEFYRLRQDHNNSNICLEKLLYLYEEAFCYEFQIFNQNTGR